MKRFGQPKQTDENAPTKQISQSKKIKIKTDENAMQIKKKTKLFYFPVVEISRK